MLVLTSSQNVDVFFMLIFGTKARTVILPEGVSTVVVFQRMSSSTVELLTGIQ
jgi:hypothetical protein